MCFNSEKTIDDCMNSVIMQSYPNIEHIVVDGGSTDGTLTIVRKNLTKNTLVISEPDRGIYDAMNKGVLLSSGDFICFLNSDDWLIDEHAIFRVVRSFEMVGSSPNILSGGVKIYKSDNSHKLKVLRNYTSSFFFCWMLKFGFMPPHPGLFVKRSLIEKFPFQTKFYIAADFDFLLRIYLKDVFSIHKIPEYLIAMRHGGVSNSEQSFKKISQEISLSLKENDFSFVTVRAYARVLFKFSHWVVAFFNKSEVYYWMRKGNK